MAGSIARVAPHMLITKDAELLKRMNAVRSPFTRAEWYTALRLHPTRDNITSITDEALHKDIRSRMAPGVSLFILHPLSVTDISIAVFR